MKVEMEPVSSTTKLSMPNTELGCVLSTCVFVNVSHSDIIHTLPEFLKDWFFWFIYTYIFHIFILIKRDGFIH